MHKFIQFLWLSAVRVLSSPFKSHTVQDLSYFIFPDFRWSYHVTLLYRSKPVEFITIQTDVVARWWSVRFERSDKELYFFKPYSFTDRPPVIILPSSHYTALPGPFSTIECLFVYCKLQEKHGQFFRDDVCIVSLACPQHPFKGVGSAASDLCRSRPSVSTWCFPYQLVM